LETSFTISEDPPIDRITPEERRGDVVGVAPRDGPPRQAGVEKVLGKAVSQGALTATAAAG
jgi:hypothetical protein